MASTYSDLGIWDESDVKFATKLHRIRNGVAHKNPRVISKEVCSGKKIHIVDIDSTMTNVDVIPLMLGTIRRLPPQFRPAGEFARRVMAALKT